MSLKNLGPIGSAVLTFIGYKQTDRQTDTQTNIQTDKPNLYIDSHWSFTSSISKDIIIHLVNIYTISELRMNKQMFYGPFQLPYDSRKF